MKKVLLIDPPFHSFFKYDRWWYSYACAQLAACLREKDIKAYVYDADKYFEKDPATKDRLVMVGRQDWYFKGVNDEEHYIWKHLKKTLKEINPDIVGVATWTSKMQSTFKTLEICKKFNPKIITCVGGYHASAKPDDFKNSDLIDSIFIGPAEETLPKWVLDGCKDKIIVANPMSINIQKLPMPSRESLLFPENYTKMDMGMIMISRGCPFDCTFCSNRLLTGLRYQMRTTEQVKEEIKSTIEKYNISSISVADANFLVNLSKSIEIAEIIKTFNIPWGCEGRIGVINDKLVSKLIECGCTNISFGIETGTNKGLKLLKKNLTVEKIMQASKILNKYDINWKCFFIIGFPYETLEDMEETRKLALSLKASYISLNSYVPLPGTEIYNKWKTVFDCMPDKIYEYTQLNPKATFIKNVKPEDYRKKFLTILHDFEEYNKTVKRVTQFYYDIKKS